MAYDFPNNPTDGQVYPVPAAAGQAQYKWIASRNHWISLGVNGSPPSEEFVPQTSATGSAVMPSGTFIQRDGTPQEGHTRWNQDLSCLEVYDGARWVCLNDPGEYPPSLGDLNVFAGITVTLTEANYTYDSITIEHTGTLILTSRLTKIRVLNNISIAGTLYLAGNVGGPKGLASFQNQTIHPTADIVDDSTLGISFNVNRAVGEGSAPFFKTPGELYSPSSQSWGTPGPAGGGHADFREGGFLVTGTGGSAGGGLILTSDSVLISATGLINANGVNGSGGTADLSATVEGSGGGTGGFVFITCDNYQQDVGGSITVDGGNGADGLMAVPFHPDYPIFVTSGGPGGGGGIIRIDTTTSYTNNGTLSSTGGTTGDTVANGVNPAEWTTFNLTLGGSSFGGRGGYTEIDNTGINKIDATNGYAIINGVRVNL